LARFYQRRDTEEHRRSAPIQSRPTYRARCPHYPHCVGCPLIDVPYPEQLARKRAIVLESLARYPSSAAVEVPRVAPAPERFGYRTRVKLVVRRNREQIALGLYVPGSHRVIDISSCPVHPRLVNQAAHYLKKKILELGIMPYDERDDSGDLRYVDFRFSAARQELSVTLVTRYSSFPAGVQLARSLMKRFPFVTGVNQNVNEARGNVIWGAEFRTLAGRETLMDRIGDVKLVFPPGVFSQANPSTARKLYEAVCKFADLNGRETVLDLYCGVGPISLYLASTARQVWSVDDSELAVNTAKQNARRNGHGNCRFLTGDVASIATKMKNDVGQIDLVVVNPPRKGVQPAAIKAIVECGAPKLIYVSCEPTTFARDLDRLVNAGYRIEHLALFDMFPQTEQVESVVLLKTSGNLVTPAD
jgi:23S rRNA (uracil1939-C5)-methyltransferase